MSVESGPALAPAPAQEQYQPSLRDRVMSTKAGMALATFAVAVGGGVAQAEGNQDVSYDVNTDVTTHISKSRGFEKSLTEITVLKNHRTVSKAKIKKAKQKGGCDFFTAEEAMEAGAMTQGIGGIGVQYGYENRDSTFCDIDGDGDYDVRAECGNKAKFKKPNEEKAESTFWVKNLGKVNVRFSAEAEAEAKAECSTDHTSAYAFGRGEASAAGRIRVNFKNKAKVEGAAKYINNQKVKIEGEAKAQAKARAFAICKEGEGPGPQPSNLPPVVTIDNLQHLYENETGVVCGTARDPENDPISASFSVTNGNIVSGEFPGNDPQEECVTVKAPANSEDDPTMTVTYTAVSPNGQGGNYTVSKSSVINVENDDF